MNWPHQWRPQPQPNQPCSMLRNPPSTSPTQPWTQPSSSLPSRLPPQSSMSSGPSWSSWFQTSTSSYTTDSRARWVWATNHVSRRSPSTRGGCTRGTSHRRDTQGRCRWRMLGALSRDTCTLMGVRGVSPLIIWSRRAMENCRACKESVTKMGEGSRWPRLTKT